MYHKFKRNQKLHSTILLSKNWSVLSCLLLLIACNQEKLPEETGTSPEFKTQSNFVNSPAYIYKDSVELKNAMAAFQLEPGLQIDLIAADPLVADPSAFTFDEKGALYVAENTGYPDPMDGKKPDTLGKISRLIDSDGDGKYDQRTTFVEGLTYPNGIMAWKGGVFVTCAPHI
ncbi:MAG: hypothetical protein GYB55_25130, partial [Cytophagales bacterium]|nr:hypothetical protein [Cytophagales bacterium]